MTMAVALESVSQDNEANFKYHLGTFEDGLRQIASDNLGSSQVSCKFINALLLD